MTDRELALQFLRCFCAGDIDALADLLAADLTFSGPFHRYRSASAYLAALRRDPPQPASFEVLSLTEGEQKVAVFYDYRKADRVTTIAQLFTIRRQRIVEMLLVFDGRGLTGPRAGD